MLDYRAIPRVTDAEVARQHPELAVLSTIAHPELAVAAPTIDAIADLHDDRQRLYLDVVLAALPAELRRILEERVEK